MHRNLAYWPSRRGPISSSQLATAAAGPYAVLDPVGSFQLGLGSQGLWIFPMLAPQQHSLPSPIWHAVWILWGPWELGASRKEVGRDSTVRGSRMRRLMDPLRKPRCICNSFIYSFLLFFYHPNPAQWSDTYRKVLPGSSLCYAQLHYPGVIRMGLTDFKVAL